MNCSLFCWMLLLFFSFSKIQNATAFEHGERVSFKRTIDSFSNDFLVSTMQILDRTTATAAAAEKNRDVQLSINAFDTTEF